MIGGLIASAAIKSGLPRWAVKLLGLALLAALAVLAWNLWLAGHDADVIEKHDTDVQLKIEQGARKADQKMTERERADDRAIAEARKEFNDATRDVPREGLTRRQLIDACRELRRSGAADRVARCNGL